MLLIILSDAGIYGQQLVNIALRSKGDPPQSLQQKLRNAFASSNTHDNDVQQKDNNILHASVEDNAEEKIDYGDDEYIVQFYPSQVEVCIYYNRTRGYCSTLCYLISQIFIYRFSFHATV